MFCTILLKYPFLFCMQTICITSSGAWKLGGFGFSIVLDQNAVDSQSTGPAFHYPVRDKSWHEYLFLSKMKCSLLYVFWRACISYSNWCMCASYFYFYKETKLVIMQLKSGTWTKGLCHSPRDYLCLQAAIEIWEKSEGFCLSFSRRSLLLPLQSRRNYCCVAHTLLVMNLEAAPDKLFVMLLATALCLW